MAELAAVKALGEVKLHSLATLAALTTAAALSALVVRAAGVAALSEVELLLDTMRTALGTQATMLLDNKPLEGCPPALRGPQTKPLWGHRLNP